MIRYLYIAVETTADAVHFFTLLAVVLVFASLTVAGGGSLLGAVVVALVLLGFNYGIVRPIGRYAARALGR
jgi:hypothetical protein